MRPANDKGRPPAGTAPSTAHDDVDNRTDPTSATADGWAERALRTVHISESIAAVVDELERAAEMAFAETKRGAA